MINREKLLYLFERYIQNTCTPEEKQEFFQLLADPSYEEQFRQISESYDAVPVLNTKLDHETTEAVWEAITHGIPVRKAPVRSMHRQRIWWAAAAVLILLTGAVFWLLQPATDKQAVAQNNLITPGTSGAILTLADGKKIVLDSLQNGLIANQSGADVLLANGQVAYNPADDNLQVPTGSIEPAYNMLTIPRGRQFRLQLPDGTNVWLNAASSLRYPTAFTGNKRIVEVTGEAYFEVAKDATRPFYVNILSAPDSRSQGLVEVLGTHFNVQAYHDEPGITTTLLEGKVKFTPAGRPDNQQPAFLKPGQEAVLKNDAVSVNDVDTAPAVAWINGMFSFKSADLHMVLRQLSRWYDVDIEYDDKIDARFSGSIYRSKDFYELLQLIEFTSNVKFIINQKTITVTPK